MSVPEELVWLIAQLRGTASRRERIRLLARGWRTLRDLSPADRIAVAHELGFDGAESLVEQLSRRGGTSPAAVLELLERAQAGEDFDALVKEYTDDRHPGIYKLTNDGAPLMSNARSRDQMVPNFGRVAFQLEVGEVGLAKYHPGNSPYGWHVIKRLE